MSTVSPGGTTRTVVAQSGATTTVVREQTLGATVGDRATAVTTRERQTMLTRADAGIQGPAGEKGDRGEPGPAAGQAFARIAAQALGGHRMVRAQGDGSVDYADAALAAHGDDVLGMTLESAVQGASITVQAIGPVEFNGWTWTPGGAVFLAGNGLLTQTPSDDPAQVAFVLPIGHAETPTLLQLQIGEPVFL